MFKAAEKQKWISFEMLLQMMWKLAECYEADGKIDQAINETVNALSLIKALKNDKKTELFHSYAEHFEQQIARMKENA